VPDGRTPELSPLFRAVLLFAALICSGCSAGSQLPVDSLVASERAFAALSVAQGTRTAFLEFLDDSSVIFRPHPVNGKEWFRGQKPRTSVLNWGPSFADCSSGGEMGYTTGPWRFYKTSLAEEPVAFGYFVSVWGRKPGGPWKVLFDVGTSTPRTDSAAVRLGPLSQAKGAAPARGGDFFESAERSFIRAVGESDLTSAYRSVAGPGCRFYRDDQFPALGLEKASPILGDARRVPRFTPLRLRASSAGDLAYVYGRYEIGPGEVPEEAGYYLRIWQGSTGSAALVLDYMSPLPSAQ
jgi:hypothetical protein